LGCIQPLFIIIILR
jgi:hypothetical protein